MSRCVYKWWGYVRRVCAEYHKTQQQSTNTAQELRELQAVDAALAEVTDQDERRIIGRYLDGEKLEPIAEAEGRTLGEIRRTVRDFGYAVAYELGLYTPTLRTR